MAARCAKHVFVAKTVLSNLQFIQSSNRLLRIGRRMSSGVGKGINVEEYFTRADVQDILKRITGFDLNKIFPERKVKDVEMPKYKLLTAKQLKEMEADAERRGHERLQMPPVKKAWSDTADSQVLAVDDIAGFEETTSHYVFTDISYGLRHQHRAIVVRELDGTLRLATSAERDRILQVYFPRLGKLYAVPKMFSEENLEKILAEHRYEYVLDRACVQFEPDDPNFIRISQRTYEHVTNHRRFDDLRSTRHFGPMAFYLAVHSNIDGLLVDMIQLGLLTDASDLVKLYHILHPDSQSAAEARSSKTSEPQQLILLYTKLDAKNGGPVELALQAYSDSQQTASSATSR